MPFKIAEIDASSSSSLLSQAVSLEIECFPSLVEPNAAKNASEKRQWLSNATKHKLFVAVDADADGKEDAIVVGFITASYSSICSIVSLGVARHHRRCGIGGSLVSHALSYGVRVYRISFACLHVSVTSPAVSFYENAHHRQHPWHFTTVRTIEGYYADGGHAYRMECDDFGDDLHTETPTPTSASEMVTVLPMSATSPHPIVLSAPHGGTLDPSSIPTRTTGCVCTEPDWNSFELASSIRAAFNDELNGPPALVALNVVRAKIDGNRPEISACECRGEGPGSDAHRLYHAELARACRECVERHRWCLLLDIHGQSHRPAVTELGYLVTSTQLLQSTLSNDSPNTLAPLLRGSDASLEDLVRGPYSLGGLLERFGEPCTPSPTHPQPVTREALDASSHDNDTDTTGRNGPPSANAAPATYFWGGYTVRRYGCLAHTVPPRASPLPVEDADSWAKRVVAVQIETCWDARVDDAARERFASALRRAVDVFVEQNRPPDISK